MGNFEKDLNYGELGENLTILKLYNHPDTKSVIDVRKDKWFQKIDIDFLWASQNGSIVKIEVKTDRKAHETGNFVFELSSNGNKGCLARSRADYVYYYVEGNDTMYVIFMSPLRDYINAHGKDFKVFDMGDGARGLLIPFKFMLDNGLCTILK